LAKNSGKPKSDYAIQTVMNAFRMLEVFDGAVAIGVSDVARSLGLHKNNAFRLLATLEIAGYVQQSADSELYHLGPRCLELAHAFALQPSLRDPRASRCSKSSSRRPARRRISASCAIGRSRISTRSCRASCC
jgi:hypothetical protein